MRQCPAHRLSHGKIITELCCVKFRITAAQIQPLYIFRQSSIRQRTERDQLCPHPAQHIQAVLIVEAKRPVLRHRNTDRLLKMRQLYRLIGQRRRLL